MQTEQTTGAVDFNRVAGDEAQYILRHASTRFMERVSGPDASARSSTDVLENQARLAQRVDEAAASEHEGAVRALLLDANTPPVDGLALSGGGIRSAAFCLGVVEGLAEAQVLSKFHYISSVSGGGYTSGWLAAWCYRDREGIPGIQRTLRGAARSPEAPVPVRHMLKYVTYLAPRSGILSVDLWSLISAYARNLLVTLCVTLPVLLNIAALPYFGILVIQAIQGFPRSQHWHVWPLLIALLCGIFLMRYLAEAVGKRDALRVANYARQASWSLVIVGGSSMAWGLSGAGSTDWIGTEAQWLGLPAYCLLATIVAIPVGLLFSRDLIYRTPLRRAGEFAVAGAASVLLAVVILPAVQIAFIPVYRSWSNATGVDISVFAATLGPILFCGVLFLAETVRQALLSRLLEDGDREWMARFTATGFVLASFWAVLCLTAIVGPLLIKSDIALTIWVVLAVTLIAVSRWMPGHVAAVAVLLASVASLVSAGFVVGEYLQAYGPDPTQSQAEGGHALRQLAYLFAAVVVLSLIAVIVDQFADVNLFSMHALYRDRLIRTFLGASRGVNEDLKEGRNVPSEQANQFSQRQPSPFHDFDAADSPKLQWLRSDESWRASDSHWMPVFLFNASINRTWQSNDRGRLVKAYPFVFSPFYCGSRVTKYCLARDYASDDGGILLGTAIATSGAALSSRTGRFDNRLLAFFLTLANLRLGWWLGNPSYPTRAASGPRFSLQAYLAEMLSRPYGRRHWIHLSDGGHFENLGAFELIKRGCRRIVVVDGSADGKRHFGDLANLIRLVREELNVNVEPLYDMGIGPRTLKQHGKYCAVFEVLYPEGGRGRLLYIKAAYYENSQYSVPLEVQSYAMEAKGFPHEPTMDQFFSPAQFDAYRQLGLHQVRTILTESREREYDLSAVFSAAIAHSEPAKSARGVPR